jgi:RNA polymerase sigma-70 factor (ECF subfamily)
MRDDPLNGLLERLCSGDTEAAEQVFVTYEPYLRMVVRRMLPARLRCKFDSVDVVHSIWADLLEGFRASGWRFADVGHLRAFLVKATRNRFLDRVRQQKKSLQHEQSLEAVNREQVLACEDDRPSQIVQAGDLWEQMLALCPPDHQELLRLKRQGLSLAEMASQTGYHPSSIRRIFYDLARRLAPGKDSEPRTETSSPDL